MQRFHRYVDLLREKLAAVQQELANEKDRRNAISAEHFTISQSLLWTQQNLVEVQASGEAQIRWSPAAGAEPSSSGRASVQPGAKRGAGRARRSSHAAIPWPVT